MLASGSAGTENSKHFKDSVFFASRLARTKLRCRVSCLLTRPIQPLTSDEDPEVERFTGFIQRRLEG